MLPGNNDIITIEVLALLLVCGFSAGREGENIAAGGYRAAETNRKRDVKRGVTVQLRTLHLLQSP